jgi:hypothetical protein
MTNPVRRKLLVGDKQGHPFRGNQWTDRVSHGGGTTAVVQRGDYMPAASGAAPTPDDDPTGEMTDTGRRLLAEHEASIYAQTWETAVVLDSSGKVLLRKSGDERSVTFTPEEVEKLRGGVLTHNHPSSSSFSDDDVQLAVLKGLREIRAVGRDGSLYRLGVGSKGWTDGMLTTYHSIRDDIQNNTRMLIGTGQITVEEANAGYPIEQEIIMKQFAKAYAHMGVYYKKARRK